MERKHAFWLLTAVLILLLALQITGAFDGINQAIDSPLPHYGLAVVLFTETGSLVAVTLYLLAIFLLDLHSEGHIDKITLDTSIALFLSMVLVAILKVAFAVPRPGGEEISGGLAELLRNIEWLAFPSGHTARVAVLAYFLSRRWKKFWLLWWGWALGIGLSRLLLHVHWFSDVLFAFMLGLWVALLVELTEEWWLPYYRAVVNALKLGVFDVEWPN